jgi:hypothetical protein
MQRGLANLHRALAPGGLLFLWIYGKHGRARHALHMRLLHLLARPGDTHTDAIDLAQAFILHADNGVALRELADNAPTETLARSVADDPIWIADQFLHPHETLIDMEELLAMARSTGFTLERLLGVPDGVEQRLGSAHLIERYRNLGPEQKLIVLDLLLKPDRYFVMLRKTGNSD